MLTWRKRLLAETGATASESMGVLLLVGLVVAAIVASPVGYQIRDGISCAVTEILGGSCTQIGREPAPDTCIQAQGETSIEGHVKITVVELGAGAKATREERADGSVKMTLEANADAGLEFGTPSADVQVDGTEGGTGQREVALTGEGRVSRSWTFEKGSAPDNAAAADEFTQDVKDMIGAAVDWKIWDDGPDLPEHEETLVAGGLQVSGQMETVNGTGLEGNLGGGIGAIFNDETGEKTIFFEVKAGGRVGSSASFFDFGGAGDGTVRVGITYDVNGNEEEMIVQGQADGALEAGVDLTGGELETALGEVEQPLAGSAGGRVSLDAKLDLNDPQNLSAARAFLDGVDPRSGRAVSSVDSAAGLYERFRDDGDVSIQTYRVDGSETGLDVDGGPVGGFGFEYSERDADLLDAWYLEDDGMRPWLGCRP